MKRAFLQKHTKSCLSVRPTQRNTKTKLQIGHLQLAVLSMWKRKCYYWMNRTPEDLLPSTPSIQNFTVIAVSEVMAIWTLIKKNEQQLLRRLFLQINQMQGTAGQRYNHSHLLVYFKLTKNWKDEKSDKLKSNILPESFIPFQSLIHADVLVLLKV